MLPSKPNALHYTDWDNTVLCLCVVQILTYMNACIEIKCLYESKLASIS